MTRNHKSVNYIFPISLIFMIGCLLPTQIKPIFTGSDEGNSENPLSSTSPAPTDQEDMLTSLLKGNLDPGPITGENADRLVELGYFLRGPATDVAFSEDGKWLAVCSLSGLALYDISSQKEKWFNEIGCSNVDISSAAKVVVTNHGIWNIETGLRLEFTEYIPSSSFRFSPDGKSLMIYKEDGSVNGFKEIPANEQNGLPLYYTEWNRGQFSPDGSLFATIQANPENPSQYGVALITFPQGEIIQFIPSENINDFSFSGDGNQLFFTTQTSFEIWSLDGRLINKVDYDSGYFPFDADFPEFINGDYIVFMNENNIRISDIITQKQIYSYTFSKIAPLLPEGTNFFLSPKNNYLAISDEKGLQIVEINTGKQKLQIDRYSTVGDGDIYFSSDKQQMIITNLTYIKSFLTLITVWDLQTKKMIKEVTFDGVLIGSPSSLLLGPTYVNYISQNKTWNIFLDTKGDLWKYDLTTQKSELLILNNQPANNQLTILDSGELIWIPSELPGAEIIPTGNWHFLSPDGRMLAILKEHHILLWDVENKKSIADMELQRIDEVNIGTFFSKNGKSLVIISKDAIWLLDTETPNQFREMSNDITYWMYESDEPDRTSSQLDVSPDGSVLAVADNQYGVYLISAQYGLAGIYGTGPFRNYEYHTVAFSDDGKLLAAGTGKGTIELFMANPQPRPPTPTPFSPQMINIEVISPADKSIVENLYPEIQVSIPNLPEGGDVNLNLDGDNFSYSISYATNPYEKEYAFETADMNLEPEKTYTWSVEVLFQDQPSVTSEEYTFSTPSNFEIPPKPTLTSPENGSSQAQPADGWIVLEWQPVAGAVDYTVCIFEADDNLGPHNGVCSEEVVGTEHEAKVELNLKNGHHYEWYVIARNAYAFSEKSDTWTFTIK